MGENALASFVRQHPRLFVLTGAGVSSDAASFRPPACDGVLKPDVVFFGEGAPAARVERARAPMPCSC